MKTFYSHLDYYGQGTMTYLCRTKYNLQEVQDPTDADVIIWNGGEDIGTSCYNEQSADPYVPYGKSARDVQEIGLFDRFKTDDTKLLLGICRGAQLLNCLNGGSLYQDVDGHNQSHPMFDTRTNEVLQVTSTHHQQMRPNPLEGKVIGVSDMSRHKLSASSGYEKFPLSGYIRNGRDVEIMWYPLTRSLCIQGHPEYVPNSRFADYTLELMNECYKESVMENSLSAGS